MNSAKCRAGIFVNSASINNGSCFVADNWPLEWLLYESSVFSLFFWVLLIDSSSMH